MVKLIMGSVAVIPGHAGTESASPVAHSSAPADCGGEPGRKDETGHVTCS